MAEILQGPQTRTSTRTAELVRAAKLVGAAEVAHDTEVRQSANGVRFATFGETGVADLDLDRMLEAVPAAIVAALKANTYYFVPLALREGGLREEPVNEGPGREGSANEDASLAGAGELNGLTEFQVAAEPEAQPAMVASAYTDEFSDAAICHRNVELEHGARGVFISTRLMGDRFALSFEFFINVAHAFVEAAGVPERFAELAWKQALDGVRGETSVDAWEGRNLALGRAANAPPEAVPSSPRRSRGFGGQRAFAAIAVLGAASLSGEGADSVKPEGDEKGRVLYLEAAFSDAVAIYLLSLALDFDYSELREREYPLLAPAALAARLRLVAELFPANHGYEFAVRYRRRA